MGDFFIFILHFCGTWFHTGDLAVFKNGRYYLKGRIDDMLKINGNRVEPFEIESACRKLLNVSECFAKVFEEGFVAVYYYISKNSTFNMVLEAGENGIPLQAYTPDTPYIRLEHITKAELESLKTNFVRPFGFGEPLIRLRAYKCGLNTYVFIHAFHMVTDCAGFHLLLEDLTKCLMGKETEKICYFSWAFEENIRNDSPVIRENLRFFNETYKTLQLWHHATEWIAESQ